MANWSNFGNLGTMLIGGLYLAYQKWQEKRLKDQIAQMPPVQLPSERRKAIEREISYLRRYYPEEDRKSFKALLNHEDYEFPDKLKKEIEEVRQGIRFRPDDKEE